MSISTYISTTKHYKILIYFIEFTFGFQNLTHEKHFMYTHNHTERAQLFHCTISSCNVLHHITSLVKRTENSEGGKTALIVVAVVIAKEGEA